MHFQVIVLTTGQQAGSNLNAVKLPVGRAVLVKVVGMKRANAKNKKKKGVNKNNTPKPVAKKVKYASFAQENKVKCEHFRKRR